MGLKEPISGASAGYFACS